MSDFENAFALVSELSSDFHAHRAEYLSAAYSEAQVRQDFIDKFFAALGWDVTHQFQKNPYKQEVRVERNVKAGKSKRRADYAFFIAPKFDDPRLFAEAKKPHGELATKDNYFQTIRYGWSSGTPLAVLTDFDELHVLDCRYQPHVDSALDARVKRFSYTDYADRDTFAEIYYLFSREAVADGALERLAVTLPKRRGRAVQRGLFPGAYQSIDESFLEMLDRYRDALARSLKAKNSSLDGEALTEITQRILDRLVFIRFLEDKDIEPEPLVAEFGSKGSAWADFQETCKRLDGIYNGIVFKAHPQLDSPKLVVDKSLFADICEEMSHLNSPYHFDAIPIHILGSIYERFLGRVIVTTEKRAKLVDKPEVRKAGGVYYTPEFVVRYIVEQAVGRLVEGKSPAQIAGMRFGDLACGSGSFLLGIYSYLIRYCGTWYNANPSKIKKGECVKAEDGTYHLTLSKKREILLNNIFGVDLDHQAVEVAQLSLYLKLLEEETTASAREHQLEFHETLLPSLSRNVVWGNALVGTDVLDGELFQEESIAELVPLDPEERFPQVMKEGGFSAIVGNPPYVRQESLSALKDYLESHYDSFESSADLFVYFLERAVKALRPGGRLGYIVSSSVLRASYAEALRRTLRQEAAIVELVDFGGLAVFQDAKDTYVCITLLAKVKQPARVQVAKVRSLDFPALSEYVENNQYTVPQQRLTAEAWALHSDVEEDVIRKIMAVGEPLGQYVDGKMYYGLKTGRNEAFEVSGGARDAMVQECAACGDLIHRVSGGQDIRRYEVRDTDSYLIVVPAGWTRMQLGGGRFSEKRAWEWFHSHFQPLAKHLSAYEEKLRRRQDQGEYWWELRPCDYYDALERPKIVFPDISKGPRFYLDTSSTYLTNTAYCLGVADPYLLALLNSRVFWFAISHISIPFGIRGGQYRYRLIYQYMEKVPIRRIDPNDREQVARRDRLAALAMKMLDAKKKLSHAVTERDQMLYEGLCGSIDHQMDTLVYELYGLSQKEAEVVEAAGR